VEVPIRIQFTNAEETPGTTANISSGGVYLKADAKRSAKSATAKSKSGSSFRKGAAVRFDMIMPAEVTGGKKNVRIQCSGHVVRVEKLKGSPSRNGVACVIDKYDFVRTS
jgi:hypothetical protein